ncbi:MAG TPA: methylated-DNA--[protein]-cysteine S-methyltransferase [Bryobacteraceae bacterium]|nr:methylated-DNA--[protein]-cysteine S-methyltransferase [Bryobacteraceae bacterium]
MEIFVGHMSSPVGVLTLAWNESGLRALDFDGFDERFHTLMKSHYGECKLTSAAIPAQFSRALEAYFAGDFSPVDRLPVATNGTPFQQAVWAALREIPPATTMSYGQLAQKLGKPGASRAVGRANGSNPIGIVVPCHRVIGADGSLTGYGGGIPRKQWLLEHERTHLFQLVS